jgi:hypothetical protein
MHISTPWNPENCEEIDEFVEDDINLQLRSLDLYTPDDEEYTPAEDEDSHPEQYESEDIPAEVNLVAPRRSPRLKNSSQIASLQL